MGEPADPRDEAEYKLQETLDRAYDLMYSKLDPKEASDMRLYEDIIDKMQKHEFSAGHALHEINQRRLYRGQFDTFNKYVDHRFHFGVRRAYQLIDAWKVYETLKSPIPGDSPARRLDEDDEDDDEGEEWKNGLNGMSEPCEPVVHEVLPTGERQLRPLAKLKNPQEKHKAWALAVANADGLQPSSRGVAEAVATIMGQQPTPTVRSAPELVIPRPPVQAAKALKAEYTEDEWRRFAHAVAVLDVVVVGIEIEVVDPPEP
jgi:hypothetical protein